MHWMVFILVVYYLLHPVRTADAGTGSPAFFWNTKESRAVPQVSHSGSRVRQTGKNK
jgi:hypothetical protein